MNSVMRGALVCLLLGTLAQAQTASWDFEPGQKNEFEKDFVTVFGHWSVEVEQENRVLAVLESGDRELELHEGTAERAKRLFNFDGDRFVKGLEPYRNFAITLCGTVRSFNTGTVEVRFQGKSKAGNQNAGIVFNVQPDGDYFVFRVSPQDSRLILLEMRDGKQVALKSIRLSPLDSDRWHSLKLHVEAGVIRGYVNQRLAMKYDTKAIVTGPVGLWSSRGSHVLFDDLKVSAR